MNVIDELKLLVSAQDWMSVIASSAYQRSLAELCPELVRQADTQIQRRLSNRREWAPAWLTEPNRLCFDQKISGCGIVLRIYFKVDPARQLVTILDAGEGGGEPPLGMRRDDGQSLPRRLGKEWWADPDLLDELLRNAA